LDTKINRIQKSMGTSRNNKVVIRRGILGPASGTIGNINVGKNNVIKIQSQPIKKGTK
jgi:hypothetical protein